MNLNEKQIETRNKIIQMAILMDIDPAWAVAVGMTESSLGIHQKSPTGCRGVFQMSMIAMKDLWQLMNEIDDDWGDIACGVAFLKLLLKRHGSIEAATLRYCDPKDRDLYIEKVKKYMEEL